MGHKRAAAKVLGCLPGFRASSVGWWCNKATQAKNTEPLTAILDIPVTRESSYAADESLPAQDTPDMVVLHREVDYMTI